MSAPLPRTMKAITVHAKDDGHLTPVVLTRPLPSLRPGYLLVKTAAVAINPVDVLLVDMGMVVPGSLLGCDYAGTVVEVGADVQRPFKKGDRVCGGTRPADPHQFENGTFAEYVVVKADLQMRIPDEMGFEEAAALGVTTVTTGRCFFDKFSIEYPVISEDGSVDTEKRKPRQLLVYGGSTAMGTMVIQYAKLANFTVLTTSSPHNAEVVRSYGADIVVDHYSPTAPGELATVAKKNAPTLGPLTLCVDNISTESSAAFCAQVLTPSDDSAAIDPPPQKILYSTILPFTPPLPGIETLRTLGYSFLGEEWEQFGEMHPASVEDFESSRRFAVVAESLLALGRVRPHPVDVRRGGLEGIVDGGLDEMRGGRVSGRKLVYVL